MKRGTHRATLDDGRTVTPDLYRALRDDEIAKLRRFEGDRYDDARALAIGSSSPTSSRSSSPSPPTS